MIEKLVVSRDDSIYEAWPDIALTPSGKLVCVFSECTHHGDRSFTRIVLTESSDRGRTWTPKRELTEPTRGLPIFWDCPRITRLRDGRLVILVNKLFAPEKSATPEQCRNYLFFSDAEGHTWSDPVETPALGIVPDKLLEPTDGRWILSCHYQDRGFGFLVQRLWYSDNQGGSWEGPVIVARQEGLNLCEVSILPVKDKLIAFHRENSGQGWDCYKTISMDRGETWGEAIHFPLPGCHRPVAGMLQDGRIMITHRFMQGGKGWMGWWTQNFFAALTDAESALAETRGEAHTRILPIDFDRSPASDTGYSGWVQFGDGEIYIVNYIVDDAPKGQIRGYSLKMTDFILTAARERWCSDQK
ncbi:MAG: glycoside hydrolase [Lentisphaeria bacterium]|nr:glycoside hydrolase [Lentisphaeria bacterium]